MQREIPRTVILIALAAMLAATSPCSADTLTKRNGQTLSGRVVSEDKDVVVFEANFGGMVMRQRVPRSQIKSLSRQVREGPGYVALPLYGEVGVEITADALKRAIAEARRHKPQYVILVIDSLGGLVTEKERICEVIRQAPDVRFIAYVKQAVSAAAVVALACPEIYVAEDSTIGATVAVMPGALGGMKVASEKVQSVVRATDRAVALRAGHSDLWVRGMSESDLELAVVLDGADSERVVEATGEPDQQVIKRRGQVLTLTGREAVEYGLARGTCADVASIKDALGLAAWHVADERPWHMLIGSGRAARAQREEAARVGPELRAIDMKMTEAMARIAVAEAALREIRKRHEADLKLLDNLYEKERRAGRGPSGKLKLDRAYRDAQTKLNNHFHAQIARCEEDARKARAEQQHLEAEREILIGRIE
jgi:membrane-bound serine protease (ClpP class)